MIFTNKLLDVSCEYEIKLLKNMLFLIYLYPIS